MRTRRGRYQKAVLVTPGTNGRIERGSVSFHLPSLVLMKKAATTRAIPSAPPKHVRCIPFISGRNGKANHSGSLGNTVQSDWFFELVSNS